MSRKRNISLLIIIKVFSLNFIFLNFLYGDSNNLTIETYYPASVNCENSFSNSSKDLKNGTNQGLSNSDNKNAKKILSAGKEIKTTMTDVCYVAYAVGPIFPGPCLPGFLPSPTLPLVSDIGFCAHQSITPLGLGSWYQVGVKCWGMSGTYSKFETYTDFYFMPLNPPNPPGGNNCNPGDTYTQIPGARAILCCK